jgi:hypothetical protein
MCDGATLGMIGERNWSYIASAGVVVSGHRVVLYLVGGLAT